MYTEPHNFDDQPLEQTAKPVAVQKPLYHQEMLLPLALLPLACISWNQLQDTLPPKAVVHVCPGERIRMVRVSQITTPSGKKPYRAVLVVRQDDTVAVKTTRHQGEFRLSAEQKNDLRDALDVIRDYRKHMFHRLPRRVHPSDDGGIDFYIEIQDGKHSLRWSNTQYERPPAVPSLFDVLEVYQYLLSPKSDDE